MSVVETVFRMPDGVLLRGQVHDPVKPPNEDGDNAASSRTSPGSNSNLHGGTPPKSLCIVAHPYARLGGSLDDHVVQSLARTLSQAPHGARSDSKLPARVVLFNARGAGQDEGAGSPSWTGAAEAADYHEVVKQAVRAFAERWPDAQGTQLVLAGYSAGALAAVSSHFDGAQELPPQFAAAPVKYVLICYPHGVLWALSLFRSGAHTKRLEELVTTTGQETTGSKVLMIHGDRDQFTGIANYEKLCARLQSVAGASAGTFKSCCVPGADHFWRSSSLRRALLAEVVRFVES